MDGDEAFDLLNATLHYGYTPATELQELPTPIRNEVSEDKFEAPESTLVEQGMRSLRDGMATLVDDLPSNVLHLLPLSGGLDSRMVLGLLAERVDRSRIRTVTIGQPIGWDYEIGQQVAAHADVANTTVNPTTWSDEWGLDRVVDHAATYPYPNRILGGHLQAVACEKAMSDTDRKWVTWSGFMGETLAGAHLDYYPTDDPSWQQACVGFARRNHLPDMDLTAPGFDPTAILPADPWVSHDALSFGEQLDFAIRQQCWIRQNVARSAHSPFTQAPWVEFILNVPEQHRRNRSLFKTIGRAMFPDLFRLPTETTDGIPLSAGETRRRVTKLKNIIRYRVRQALGDTVARPTHQFMDFDSELRRHCQFRDTVELLISGLADRNRIDWVEPLDIWRKHQTGAGLQRELRLLASMESFFRASTAADERGQDTSPSR